MPKPLGFMQETLADSDLVGFTVRRKTEAVAHTEEAMALAKTTHSKSGAVKPPPAIDVGRAASKVGAAKSGIVKVGAVKPPIVFALRKHGVTKQGLGKTT